MPLNRVTRVSDESACYVRVISGVGWQGGSYLKDPLAPLTPTLTLVLALTLPLGKEPDPNQ